MLNSNKQKNLPVLPDDLLVCLEEPKESNEKPMGQIIQFIKVGQLENKHTKLTYIIFSRN